MKAKNYKNYLKNIAMPAVVFGAITGAAVGTLVFFFKLVAEHLSEWSGEIYHLGQEEPWIGAAIIGGVVVLALIAFGLQKWAPETAGGGIPRAEGVLRGLLTVRWLRTGIGVAVNSWISFFAGLPLGSEGPSVLIGTAAGDGTSKVARHRSWRRYIMTGGACAGFAVATAAPVTGILFALEEAHKRFTTMIALSAMSSVLAGIMVANLWGMALGQPMAPLFAVELNNFFTLKEIWIPVVLGLAVGILAMGYNRLVFWVGRVHDKLLKRVPQWVQLVAVFVLTAGIGLLSIGSFNGTDALFGGGELIVGLAEGQFALKIIGILLAVRFLVIALSTGSGATGGVFIPMLSIGALLGALFGNLFMAMGMDSSLLATVVIMTMTSFMGATTRTPLTALVFMIESTWGFSNLFFVSITVFISYLICEVCKIEPLYDVLLERMVRKQNRGKKMVVSYLHYRVEKGSFAVGKAVRDIMWPANTKVNKIAKRTTVRMDDDGEYKLQRGDRLVLIVQTCDLGATKQELREILGEQKGKMAFKGPRRRFKGV